MNKIKIFRLEKDMTLKELSEKSKVAIGYISTLENDCEGNKNPSKDIMERISEALDKTVPEVFFPEKSEVN